MNLDEIEAEEEYKILFALQTSVAIIAILLAYKIVSTIKYDRIEFSLADFTNLDYQVARTELENIANGNASNSIGIYNLLEIECFVWPFRSEQWSRDIYLSIDSIIKILKKYEDRPALTEKTEDLFRDLYMAIMPSSVRHSLGEYYTDMWLTENVNNQALDHLPIEYHEGLRVLDPNGGSGTFTIDFIHRKREAYKDLEPEVKLKKILNEVAMIDANILAVILARINYFIGVSDLIIEGFDFHIPVYIGDSTVSNADMMSEDNKYICKAIQTSNGDVEIRFPMELLSNKDRYAQIMQDIQVYLRTNDDEKIKEKLSLLNEDTSEEDLDLILGNFKRLNEEGLLTTSVINSITNFFITNSLGKFDLIVGNPPWVDWKSLPSVFRENIKASCVSRDLFSGDVRTGGISLNICALITNIAAENWLKEKGVLAFLMPQSILFQQSYEGFRNLKIKDGRQLYLQEVTDWTRSGHPFHPVQQLFCTYIISDKKQNYDSGVSLKLVKLNEGQNLRQISSKISGANFNQYFNVDEAKLVRLNKNITAFSYSLDNSEVENFRLITGSSDYIGREGVEFYPQEVQLLKLIEIKRNKVKVENYQSNRSKFQVPKKQREIETKYLRPLVKGIDIKRFHIEESKYIVAFPYDRERCKSPIPSSEIYENSRLLYNYYTENRPYLEGQTQYSNKLINDDSAEFYALARTGVYSHAPYYVLFRDNTKWVSAVTGAIDTEWGGEKMPAFQNHCVSISQNVDGDFITESEAHYICAILNSNIVEKFILSSSDKRTFKIRLPIRIPKFDPKIKAHRQLSYISIKAHERYNDDKYIETVRKKADDLYLEALKFDDEKTEEA